MKIVFILSFLLTHSPYLFASSECNKLLRSQQVTVTLHDSFHVTYQGNELLGHKLSPNISVNGHQNKLAFNGSRVFRDNRTHQTFITPYAWTVFELSILAGKLLSDSEIEKLQQIHEIGRNQTGANGELATTGNYTFGQLKQKSKEFKQAFPYLDPNAFYRFIINGALGDPPTSGSSHPPPTYKRDFAAYLGNTRYFPIFREFLIHLKTTTPDESQESLLGLPVEFCCTMRHKITYLKKNVIHQKKKAWQITFSIRTQQSFILQGGQEESFDQKPNNSLVTFFYAAEDGKIYEAKGREPWKLIWLEPQDGLKFSSAYYPGHSLTWKKIDYWISPRTGNFYAKDVFKLIVTDPNLGQIKSWMIFVPEQGLIYSETNTIDTADNVTITAHSSENSHPILDE